MILAILVDLLSPMIFAKIRPQGLFGSGEKILKVFTIYGHCSHLGQWTMTILAIFRSPALRRLHMKFDQHWPRGFRGGYLKFSSFFFHTWKRTWPHHKKVKSQCTTIILAALVYLQSSMICAVFCPKATLVLKKTISKSFYHTRCYDWALPPSIICLGR